MTDLEAEAKSPKDRSPAYPFISLQVAAERLVSLEAMFRRHPVPANKAGLAWDMKEGSSQAAQTLAALKYFGFIDYQGSGSDRQAILTEEARTYIRAQQESIKREVLRAAALKPKAIATYWTAWGADRPPNPVCLDQLVLKGGFTESAAETFLRVYDETIGYAGLTDFGTNEPVNEQGQPAVQQETQQQVTQPFVRGYVAPAGTRQAVFTLDEGDVSLTFPAELSANGYQELKAYLDIFLKRAERQKAQEAAAAQAVASKKEEDL